jgi:hypothetical protein
MFKEVDDFFDLGTVVCEGNPLFTLVVGFINLGFVLCFLFQLFYEMQGEFIVVLYGEYFLPSCFLPIDQVAVGSDFVFCRVVGGEVNGGVCCCGFLEYINFYF